MEVEAQKIGGSLVFVLPRLFKKINDVKEGDIFNISDSYKVKVVNHKFKKWEGNK